MGWSQVLAQLNKSADLPGLAERPVGPLASSDSLTVTSSDPATTWLFVTKYPFLMVTTPVPNHLIATCMPQAPDVQLTNHRYSHASIHVTQSHQTKGILLVFSRCAGENGSRRQSIVAIQRLKLSPRRSQLAVFLHMDIVQWTPDSSHCSAEL